MAQGKILVSHIQSVVGLGVQVVVPRRNHVSRHDPPGPLLPLEPPGTTASAANSPLHADRRRVNQPPTDWCPLCAPKRTQLGRHAMSVMTDFVAEVGDAGAWRLTRSS